MKKLVFAVILTVSVVAGLPVFAQNQKDWESDYYYVNIPLEKIYPYHKGYIVQYRKGLFQYGRAYLPASWFVDTDSKGEIIPLPPGKSWPSLTIYYHKGVFSHVRLYVHRLASHQTWGNLPMNINLDDRFDDIETIKIEY